MQQEELVQHRLKLLDLMQVLVLEVVAQVHTVVHNQQLRKKVGVMAQKVL